MKVCDYLDIKPTQELPGVTKREVEPGSSTPHHSHAWEHEVFILAGQGVAMGEQGETKISSGSTVFVPPEEQHCFVNNGNETLRFICLIPLTD